MTDLWKIEVSLVYVASSRPAGDTGRPCQTKTKNYNQKKKRAGRRTKVPILYSHALLNPNVWWPVGIKYLQYEIALTRSTP